MKQDKLDRWRNSTTAALTAQHDIPFWFGLTSTERKRMAPHEVGYHFRRTGADRKAFRDFVRGLAQ